MKEMKQIEKAMELKHKKELKMLKEMAFFLELEGFEYNVWLFDGVELTVNGIENDGLDFQIKTSGSDYVLEAEYLEYEEGYGDHTYVEKLKRKTAKSIVNNIVRINDNITELAKKQRKEIKERYEARVNAEKRYKEKIREEVIAELQNEQKAIKKAPAKKRTRKAVKKTENTESVMTLPAVPPAPTMPEAPMIDIAYEDAPDF
ncbi:hypothetical protein M2E15_2922 [Bacillus mycoides]|uniref:hypothetical protein n=1 Tax=Bacillus mycoides TaxID=1405 RepID=UPI00073F4A2C|nr:hypothetical protein [Bacillus mycoides]KUH46058.1 hypothetical protein M2E15_2922 [Bacillus mycoides]